MLIYRISDAIDKLQATLHNRGMFARKLKTDNKAYHSTHMRTVRRVYEELLSRVWRHGKVEANQVWDYRANGHSVSTPRMISSVTKTDVTCIDVSTPSYWRMNLESPVEFAGAISLLLRDGPAHFVELGPHSTLELPIKQTVNQTNSPQINGCLYNSALSRGKDTAVSVLSLVGSFFLNGHDEISFKSLLESSTHKPLSVLTDLPAYPWDYESQCPWHEPRIVSEFRSRNHARHDLLGSQVPGGSKATTTWRNIINVEEISWLKDHRLGPSIVFPAAAYIAMAIESVCQVSEISLANCPGVTIKNMAFLKAMNFHVEKQPRIEIFTEMEPLRTSNTTTSPTWWRFTVNSISRDASQSFIHAVCIVRLSGGDTKTLTQRRIKLNQSSMVKQATHVWYEKFTQEGLNWGPQFAVMENIFCDSARRSFIAAATTHLVREENSYQKDHLKHIAHPINIDSMLQTAFVATTRGWARDLRAKVPVSIDTVEISSPAALDIDATKSWSVESTSESVGFGTVNIDAELINQYEDVLVRMHNVRAIRFQGNTQTDNTGNPSPKTPLVRVVWKPDITALPVGPNNGLSEYLDWFEKIYSRDNNNNQISDIRLAGALDLVAFKFPNLRILAIGFQPETVNLFKTILRAEQYLARFEIFKEARIAEDGGLSIVDCDDIHSTKLNGVDQNLLLEKKFDIIITSSVSSSTTLWKPQSAILM
jgi:acyl transferase domain-containing protein